MPGEGWPKSARLRKRREFLDVQGKGTKAQGQWLTALAKPGKRGRRLGITVSTKVGNSVVRSRVKRWIREAFRKHQGFLPEGVEVVVIARPGTGEAGFAAIVKDLEKLGRALKAKLLARPNVMSKPAPKGGPSTS
ncbi:MAG: ribonuclease P protein component [Deltaproteobacteria bacterium]|nr:ribonuclease P protein component [Deltaproteobacteria bacterium]